MKKIISFDDGAKEDLRLFDLIVKYGTFDEVIMYLPSEWITYNLNESREPLSVEDVFELDKYLEIGSHSVTHCLLTRMPLFEAEREITESKAQLEALLNHDVTSFCCPRGYSNPELQKIIGKHYKTARNTLVGSLKPPEDPLWQSTAVHIGGKRRKEYEGSTWLEHGLRLIKEAKELEANGSEVVFHVWGHSWEMTREAAWQDTEAFFRELENA